jgi:Protein of unknown function (DUF4235)
MKLLYKPIGLILGLLAGLAGKKLFEFVWTKLDDEEPPEFTTQETTWRRVLAVAALEGVIFRVTRAAADRWGAVGWQYLTGSWPGERRADPDD